MNKKSIIIIVAIILLVGIVVVGMSMSGKDKNENDPAEQEQEQVKGNYDVEECMKRIEPTMQLEEVNEIIGFEGEKKEGKDAYVWQLTDKTKIEVEYKDGLGTITATMDKDKIKDDKLKISICYGIQNSLRSGTSFTYEEMVQELEGIEGHLATKAPTFKRYIWVNKDKQTFEASFSDSANGKCSITSIQ